MIRFVSVSLLLLALVTGPILPASAAPDSPATTTAAWLEPNGLSIVDLVGLVPEDRLRDAIVSWQTNAGILQYVSGARTGDVVTIRVRVLPRFFGGEWVSTHFLCLGKLPSYDSLGVVSPGSSMRIWEGATEVTGQLVKSFFYVPAGQRLPDSNTREAWRYAEVQSTLTFINGEAVIPPNRGCQLFLSGLHYNLTAEFKLYSPKRVTATVVGQEDMQFHSVVFSGGNWGRLSGLMGQMYSRFGFRHEKPALSIPATADYVLVLAPPQPADMYSLYPEYNLAQPDSGTYRLMGPEGNTLSVDITSFMGIPLRGQWQDGDQTGGDYLRYFSSTTRLAGPEYAIPAGLPFNGCMGQGNCPDSVLDAIYNTPMTLKVTYLKVDRVSRDLVRVPLRAVGPSWSVSKAAPPDEAGAATTADPAGLQKRLFLPMSSKPKPTPIPTAPPLPPDDPIGCPCGWFDTDGRMVDFIPPQ